MSLSEGENSTTTDRNQKVFAAGGTGMVGSAIIRKLIASGYTRIVTNYSRRTAVPPGHPRHIGLSLL